MSSFNKHRHISAATGLQVPAEALYIHIPFCQSRCHYCDFATAVAPAAVRDAYVQALTRELALLRDEASRPLKSVYFGGGTPTLLSANQLRQVLECVHKTFPVAVDAEITFEANPGTVTREKLMVLQSLGVNRLSFGAQTFNEALLLALGRRHEARDVDESLALAQTLGFNRLSIDLMFGLPNQTLEDVETALSRFFSYDIEHLSAYWLKIEPGTPFYTWHQQGLLPLPGEDAEADMYEWVRHRMTTEGWQHYEISNFAKPGRESVHNLVYWRNQPYLAAGLGAYGYSHQIRSSNTRSMKDYLQMLERGQRPVAERQSISPQEYAENTMMLGLRLQEGVSRRRFLSQHGVAMEELFDFVIRSLIAKGWVQWQQDRLVLVPEMWPVGNVVFEEFVGVLGDEQAGGN